jgi:hypothetical protein
MGDQPEIRFTTEYSKDALFLGEETDVEDIHEWLKDRVKSPVIVDGSIIWNFSTHQIDEDGLRAVADELDDEAYRIPYNVKEAWAYMCHVLPVVVRDATPLHYQPEYGGYKVFENFFTMCDGEAEASARAQMEADVRDGLVEDWDVEFNDW